MWWRRARPARVAPAPDARAPLRGTPRNGARAFARPVYLDGHLSGDITTSEPIIVRETAVIRANIKAPSIIISGEVHGDVTATTSIELLSPARLIGKLSAPEIVIEPGVFFSGSCWMPSDYGGS